MLQRFGRLAVVLAIFAAIFAGAAQLLKKYYNALGNESDDFDEGDELDSDVVYEVPDPLAKKEDDI